MSIDAPDDGATVLAGATILLGATATDSEDGDLSAQVTWTSSIDGALGTGATLPVSTLVQLVVLMQTLLHLMDLV